MLSVRDSEPGVAENYVLTEPSRAATLVLCLTANEGFESQTINQNKKPPDEGWFLVLVHLQGLEPWTH